MTRWQCLCYCVKQWQNVSLAAGWEEDCTVGPYCSDCVFSAESDEGWHQPGLQCHHRVTNWMTFEQGEISLGTATPTPRLLWQTNLPGPWSHHNSIISWSGITYIAMMENIPIYLTISTSLRSETSSTGLYWSLSELTLERFLVKLQPHTFMTNMETFWRKLL